MHFNPRLREGGDASKRFSVSVFTRFQSTPPRGRRQKGMESPFHGEYFNPRLREGGDLRNSCYLPYCIISIHASAREATWILSTAALGSTISIHASAREATACECWSCGDTRFQSTPPRGRRPLTGWTLSQQTYFNPRLREGGDLEIQREIGLQHHFNPRLREGGDSESEQTGWGCSVFQSTPPRGRRPGRQPGSKSWLAISIHASAREATALITNFYI